LSDLTSGCEYHTAEKTCLAVIENPKAQINRQLHCLNDDKQSCCYICDSRRECPIRCKYLGEADNTNPTQPKTETLQPPAQTATFSQPEIKAACGIPVAYCTSCNVEMDAKKAKLKLEGVPSVEEVLLVIVYLCPLCGRIEFRANSGS